MDSPLRYNVSKWQQYLWEDHLDHEKIAQERVTAGEERYEGFDRFSKEIFHRLYSSREKPLAEDQKAKEFAWADKLHQAISETQEFEQMQESCKGDDFWAGNSAQILLNEVLENTPEPEEKIEDPEEIQNKINNIQEMMDDLPEENPSEFEQKAAEGLQEQLKSLSEAKESALRADQEYSEGVDSGKVREAVRRAVAHAQEEKQEVESAMRAFGADIEKNGKRIDKEALREQISRLRNSPKLKKIIEITGRLKNIAISKQRTKRKEKSGEIVGVESGNDINKMLPTEALYALDEVSEYYWYKKFSEHNLAQYKTETREKQSKGPIVACIDVSGSMNGYPAQWAGALILVLLDVARKQKRSAAVIHFNGAVVGTQVFSRKDKISFDDVLAAVDFRAGGGTDFEAPLNQAVRVIKDEDEFKEADIVFVTDGSSSVSDEFLKAYKKAKEVGQFSCYSILIGSDSSVVSSFSDDVSYLSNLTDDETKMHHIFEKI